jgi:hypothetical protein
MHALWAGEVQSFVTLWTKICRCFANRTFAPVSVEIVSGTAKASVDIDQ